MYWDDGESMWTASDYSHQYMQFFYLGTNTTGSVTAHLIDTSGMNQSTLNWQSFEVR